MKQKNLGIIYILGSAFFFALMNLFVNLSGDLPVFEKSFFRNLVAMAAAFVLLLRSGEGFRIGSGNLKYLLIRSIAGTIGIFCNFYAVSNMNISDASMLNKFSPFFAIIFSVFVLGEIASRFEWLTVVVAFIGAMFVAKPSLHMEAVPALIGLSGGLMAGLAYTYVRKLGTRGERGNMIVFFFSSFSCLVTLPYLIFDFHPMTGQQLVYLLLAGCAATGGQLCITKAYTKAPAKEISVYDYSQVIFAALLGFFVLGQVPDRYSVIGYVIIIAAAVAKWRYTGRQSGMSLTEGKTLN
jgi:drug/metabolite transporter (DMT)-like permease